MNQIKIKSLLMIVFLAVLVLSCQGKEKKPDAPSLELSTKELYFTAKGGQQFISVIANSRFNAQSSSTWCDASPLNSMIDNLKITVAENETTEERIAAVTITSDGAADKLTVKQQAAIPVPPPPPPPPLKSFTTNDVLLSYINIGNSITKEMFMPCVAYLVNDQIMDTMFDSFTLLPNPNYLYHYGSQDFGMKAMTKSDWQSYINDIQYARGVNMDALEAAVGEVTATLGKNDYQAGVFLSLFYPVRSVSNFGVVDGKNLNLSNLEDRKAAVKWMVDEHVRQFRAKNYRNVELAGFYWFIESMRAEDPDMTEVVKYITDYVRSLDLITTWVPYFKARGYNYWREYGFDKVAMQANYFPARPDAPNAGPISRLTEVAALSKSLDMGVELELHCAITDADAIFKTAVTGFKQYMKVGVEKDYMKVFHKYYMGNGPIMVNELCTRNSYTQSAYDELYLFIKKTLKVSDMTIEE
jgi:hypothetical protein